ncbi:hypothetical protein E2C01_006293 [Portunus trituberculatus]|uniref:Uncharacterized protein n=1 Tax=Portunus trituberculatus TaxID=210409 RepID=A0A5B7CWR9_PORTR|nr:hypothetical protein [Portunus trituberculatus]
MDQMATENSGLPKKMSSTKGALVWGSYLVASPGVLRRQLKDGYPGGYRAPDLEAEPLARDVPGKAVWGDPGCLDYVTAVDGSEDPQYLSEVCVLVKWLHLGIVVDVNITVSLSAGHLPVPQTEVGLLEEWHLGDVVLPQSL